MRLLQFTWSCKTHSFEGVREIYAKDLREIIKPRIIKGWRRTLRSGVRRRWRVVGASGRGRESEKDEETRTGESERRERERERERGTALTSVHRSWCSARYLPAVSYTTTLVRCEIERWPSRWHLTATFTAAALRANWSEWSATRQSESVARTAFRPAGGWRRENCEASCARALCDGRSSREYVTHNE